MNKPEQMIDGAQVICWSPIDERHTISGSCHVTLDGETRSPYAGLAIVRRPDDPMTYLFYCDDQWKPVTDTYHSGIERAKEEAEREFSGVNKTWNEVG